MIFPVKFNRAFWPEALTKILPSAADPRILIDRNVDEVTFSNAVSTFKFGTTFKSTKKARFPLTIKALASLEDNSHHPVILDVGASDGTTSLDVMQCIPFLKYFVTDLNIEVFYQQSNKNTYFYDEMGVCILIVTDKWIVYPDLMGAIFPFRQIARLLFKNAPGMENTAKRIVLINPLLQTPKNKKVLIEKYNIMDTWPFEKVNLVIAANILNRSYFSDEWIKQALKNLTNAINKSGYLAIIDNREVERGTIFHLENGALTIEKKINGGTEIENLVLGTFTGRK